MARTFQGCCSENLLARSWPVEGRDDPGYVVNPGFSGAFGLLVCTPEV